MVDEGLQKQILERLVLDQENMVTMLGELTMTDSPSRDKPLMDAFVRGLRSRWIEAGAEARLLPDGTQGDHLEVSWGSGEGQILVLCHMDTVWDVGESARRPFKVENGRAYGPGAYDMKGGIVETLFAVKTLISLGATPQKKIVVLHNSDEEIGSPTSRPIIEKAALESDAVLVLEPSAQGGTLKTWRKGVGMFQVQISGRAAHAGADYEKGASAIEEAAHQIIHLHSLTDLDEGVTVNVGTAHAGSRANVIADNAILDIDVRVKTAEATSWLLPKINGLKAFDPRCVVTVSGGINRPPMERNPKNVGLFQVAKAIGAMMGVHLVESGSGGGSDGNFTSALGIPTLDGLGPVGDEAHSLGEYVLVRSLPERAAVVAGLLLSL